MYSTTQERWRRCDLLHRRGGDGVMYCTGEVEMV